VRAKLNEIGPSKGRRPEWEAARQHTPEESAAIAQVKVRRELDAFKCAFQQVFRQMIEDGRA
jgi:hypothetical protein